MDYNHIEKLAMQSKHGDIRAKESLANEFTPLILNLSKRSFINSYEFEDIRNECYKILFKCVSMYNPDKHRFVAYATNAIKNSVYHLIRTSVRRSRTEGATALILNGSFGDTLYAEHDKLDDVLIDGINRAKLKASIKNLPFRDRELINYIYFKGYSLKKYSELKGVPYTTAVSRKISILNKLKKNFNKSINGEYHLN